MDKIKLRITVVTALAVFLLKGTDTFAQQTDPTLTGMIAQKNQFSTYKSGALANRTPNQSSVIAAKLVLDGGEVSETNGALYFDSSSSSWASRNREFAAVLGGHKFYY